MIDGLWATGESEGIDISQAHPARRYDYWLGGKDNFAADRASADQIAGVFPHVRTAARENRRFLHRAVSYLVREAGIDQFLDLGTGIPTSPNVHEVAQASVPGARVVYVDNDPMVMAHARARMTSAPAGRTAYVQADLRAPGAILADAQLTSVLDLSRPVGLLLVAVLHFLEDGDDPYRAVAGLVEALAPGSYVALSHATFDPLPAHTAARLSALIAPGTGHGVFRPRSRDEVARFLDGLGLVEPGLCSIARWRPEQSSQPAASEAEAAVYGAVARR
jgi:hypothetical protein